MRYLAPLLRREGAAAGPQDAAGRRDKRAAGRGTRRDQDTGGRGATQAAPLPSAGEVDTGAFNPVLGYSYEELATMSRSMHHSQGTGAMRRPGAGMTGHSDWWPAHPAIERPLRRHRHHLEPVCPAEPQWGR